MMLTITPQTSPRGIARLRVDKTKGDGSTVAFTVYAFDMPEHFKKGAKELGVKRDILQDFILNAYGQRNVITLDLATPSVTSFRIREEVGKVLHKVTEWPLALQLAKNIEGTVIEWDGTEAHCCLDVDFHAGYIPAPFDLLAACELLRPTPLHWWLSKGGGLHLMYAGHEDYTADEMAAVAAYCLSCRFPLAAFEFLHRTRRPPGEAYTRVSDPSVAALQSLLRGYTPGDYAEWLEARGMQVGGRYPHTQCPVNPSVRAEGNSAPVVPHADHVHCFICAADGRTHGSRTPGHFPADAITGTRINTSLGRAVENCVHWGHARYLIGRTISNDKLARRVYSALLRLRHGADPRIPLIFLAGEPNGLVRYDGYWCDYNGAVLSLGNGSRILQDLPHCQSVDSAGDVTPNPAAVEWLTEAIDHSCRGFIPMHPIRGIQLTQFQTLPDSRLYTVLQTPALAREDMAQRRPQYVPATMRQSMEEAWKKIEAVYPGVDRSLIELLIVGRGCVEHRAGLPPMLFLTGPTGSGKTGHVQIASAIVGDCMTDVIFCRDVDRLRQQLITGKQSGAFLFFDEIFKKAKSAGKSEIEAMESLLSFTPDSTSHVLYVGPVRLGDLPFFLWADTHLPLCVLQHEQIGRRVFQHRLPGALSWEASLRDSGIGEPRQLRERGSPELLQAANDLLSHVMDRWFGEGVTDFAHVATLLGFKRMRDGEAVQDKYNLIRDLYAAVCTALPPDAQASKRFGRGAKLATPDGIDPVYVALDQCWAEEEKRQCQCRMVDEADLMKVLNLRCPARMELRRHGNKIAVRFISLDEKLVNEELQ